MIDFYNEFTKRSRIVIITLVQYDVFSLFDRWLPPQYCLDWIHYLI